MKVIQPLKLDIDFYDVVVVVVAVGRPGESGIVNGLLGVPISKLGGPD